MSVVIYTSSVIYFGTNESWFLGVALYREYDI